MAHVHVEVLLMYFPRSEPFFGSSTIFDIRSGKSRKTFSQMKRACPNSIKTCWFFKKIFNNIIKSRLLNNTTFPDNNKFLNTRADMWCNPWQKYLYSTV